MAEASKEELGGVIHPIYDEEIGGGNRREIEGSWTADPYLRLMSQRSDQSTHEDQRVAGKEPFYVVRNVWRNERVDDDGVNYAIGRMRQRTNADCATVLNAQGMSERIVSSGLAAGEFKLLGHEEVLGFYPPDKTVLTVTGGGDTAGLGPLLASVYDGLRPDLRMLGVKNAGKGLTAKGQVAFHEMLVPVDGTLATEWRDRSSTPLGSARVNPFGKESDREALLANIMKYRAICGSGGDDHMGMIAKISEQLPHILAVATAKTIDSDVCVDGQRVYPIGANTAMRLSQGFVHRFLMSAVAHRNAGVVEIFGRHSGVLAVQSGNRNPYNLAEIRKDNPGVAKEMESYGDRKIILVPEKPVSLKTIAEAAERLYAKKGSCLVVTAEGFVPPELASEVERLSRDVDLALAWETRTLGSNVLADLVHDPDLKEILRDPELAGIFGKMIWQSKRDGFGNLKLEGIGKIVDGALRYLAGIKNMMRPGLETYDLRGAQPSPVDLVMANKIGEEIAQLLNSDGLRGGYAVVYLDGQDPFLENPRVLPLRHVNSSNNLNFPGVWPNSYLEESGVLLK